MFPSERPNISRITLANKNSCNYTRFLLGFIIRILCHYKSLFCRNYDCISFGIARYDILPKLALKFKHFKKGFF